MKNEHLDLEQRIDELETKIRIHFICLCIIGVIAALFVVAREPAARGTASASSAAAATEVDMQAIVAKQVATELDKQGELRLRRLILVDDTGRQVGHLTGESLLLEQGDTSAILGTLEGDSVMILRNRSASASIRSGNGASTLALHRANGNQLASLTANAIGSSLVFGIGGQTRGVFSTRNESAPTALLTDNNGRVLWQEP